MINQKAKLNFSILEPSGFDMAGFHSVLLERTLKRV